MVFALAVGAHSATPARVAAQVDVRQAEATRAQLESLYARLSPKERVYAEAVALKERLDDGDFQVGDRIILTVRGDTALSDTFVVNQDRAIVLPNIGAVPLNGVLRSELQAHLLVVLSRYLRAPELQAQSLMRVGVVGQVARPGYFYLPATAVASDAFTAAGGLTTSSDLAKSTIGRTGKVLLDSQQLQQALSSGRTLDQMNMQSGDEFQIAEKSHAGIGSTVIVIGAIAGVILSVVTIISLVGH
jgi:protein involved in polysaccharide export with SLBB domain